MTKPPTPVLMLVIAWAFLLLHALASVCHAHTPVSKASSRTRRNVLEASVEEAEARDDHEDFPSSGASVPNSWLYKFPPWFLPNNPAPEGFAKHQFPPPSSSSQVLTDTRIPSPGHPQILFPGGSPIPNPGSPKALFPGGSPISNPGGSPIPNRGGPKALFPGASSQVSLSDDPGVALSDVRDGDVVIVSDLRQGERTGRLQNIRLRGDSDFKEELLRTILEVKLLNKEVTLQTSTPSGPEAVGGVTPFQLPLSAAPPPPPAPAPTQPFVLQDLAGGGDVPASHGLGGATPGVGKASSGGRFGGTDPARPPFASPPGPAPLQGEADFKPSPPDLTFANQPPPRSFLHSAPSSPLHQAPPRDPNFNLPPLVPASPHAPGTQGRPKNLLPRPPQRGLTESPFARPVVEHNAIADAFFKDREEALLKAADGAKVRGSRGQGDADAAVWIPFIPGIPLPILVQHSLAARRRHKEQRTRSLGSQPPSPPLSLPPTSSYTDHRPFSRPRGPVASSESSYPTSIQDILNSRLDTSEELYSRGRASSFSPRNPSASSSGEKDLGLLAWARS
ncbi:WAS/WASL-interacting protein family member 3-like [Penaeus japonicus]|uniref:WAS/WASL-interacting protein family member 3-like n=1 Tax=Penaeus japonicus TaxID=27405 RepID=UPI001C70B02F|nr:WAS/WASL-interacting protein family member 3-like [Penaeus japonicus]